MNPKAIPINLLRLQELRIRKGWSQEELANQAGVSTRTVENIVAKGTASLGTAQRLAEAFGITLDELIHATIATPETSNPPPTEPATPIIVPPSERIETRRWHKPTTILLTFIIMLAIGLMWRRSSEGVDVPPAIADQAQSSAPVQRVEPSVADLQAKVKLALNRYDNKEFDKALELYLEAAKAGHPFAMNEVGGMYQDAVGIAQDLEQAFYWYGKAAESGNIDGMGNLAWMYLNGLGTKPNPKEGLRLLEIAAEKKHPRSLYNLGSLYEMGLIVNQDFGRATELFSAGANLGYAHAMTSLGRRLVIDTKDYAKAIEWLQKAANLDNPRAMHLLGMMHEQGLGVPPNREEAKKWYQKAADRQFPDAIERLKKWAPQAPLMKP